MDFYFHFYDSPSFISVLRVFYHLFEIFKDCGWLGDFKILYTSFFYVGNIYKAAFKQLSTTNCLCVTGGNKSLGKSWFVRNGNREKEREKINAFLCPKTSIKIPFGWC